MWLELNVFFFYMQNSILGKNKQTTTTKSARKPHSSVNLPLYSFEKATLIKEKQRELSVSAVISMFTYILVLHLFIANLISISSYWHMSLFSM